MLNPSAVMRLPVPPEQVRIYRTADQIKSKYEEIALLNSKGASSMTNEQDMMESMRAEAGVIGANAIILEAFNEPGWEEKIAAAVLARLRQSEGYVLQRKGRAVAVFVFPDSATKKP